jgi:hypothetical protein
MDARTMDGPWEYGYAIAPHTISSVCVGNDEYGTPVYFTKRS